MVRSGLTSDCGKAPLYGPLWPAITGDTCWKSALWSRLTRWPSFCVGCEVFISQAVVQSQIRKNAPIVVSVQIHYIGSKISLRQSSLNRRLLRQSKQIIGEAETAVRGKASIRIVSD